jgi:hypothetical protein
MDSDHTDVTDFRVRSVQRKSPLFVKLALQALAIVTSDTAIMEVVARVNTWDPAVKYDPDVTRLTSLQHLAKVRPRSRSGCARILR